MALRRLWVRVAALATWTYFFGHVALECSETVVGGGGGDLDLLAFLAAGATGAGDRLGISFLLIRSGDRGERLIIFGKLNDMCAFYPSYNYSLILTGMDWLWKYTLDYDV